MWLTFIFLLYSLQSADEIREILNLPELTPEEEGNARLDYRWLFETS